MARSGRQKSLVGLLTVGLAIAASVNPAAAQPVVTEFPIPTPSSLPQTIAVGPDGNLWFTERDGNKIGRITPGGVVTEFVVPTASSVPWGITAGPDGNLWFTERDGNKIGRITPAGVITETDIPTATSRPRQIAAGPDGNLWFTESLGNRIGQITPAGVITEFPVPTADSSPYGITAGPDGNLWFTELFRDKIGRITPAGAITEFPLPNANSQPRVITPGPDGNLWFSEQNGRIGRITPGGDILEFLVSIGPGEGLSTGPDGNLWFTAASNIPPSHIGYVTPTGASAVFVPPAANSSPISMVVGPDGRMWYLDARSDNQVARLAPVSLTISPGSGVLMTTQHFDLTLRIFPAGLGLTGGQALIDGADVTPTLAACIVPGTLALVAGGLTFRCPNLTGGFAPGVRTFSIRADFTDGSSARDSVLWQFEPNHEP